jgi:beta-phosphoglucomutase-like phosphatase (HAD superfamily)
MAFQGAIFDVDGVLVDSPHELAWRESLRRLMEGEWRELREPDRPRPGGAGPLEGMVDLLGPLVWELRPAPGR